MLSFHDKTRCRSCISRVCTKHANFSEKSSLINLQYGVLMCSRKCLLPRQAVGLWAPQMIIRFYHGHFQALSRCWIVSCGVHLVGRIVSCGVHPVGRIVSCGVHLVENFFTNFAYKCDTCTGVIAEDIFSVFDNFADRFSRTSVCCGSFFHLSEALSLPYPLPW